MKGSLEYRALKELIERETSFALVSHINPDGDSIGSLAAMSHLLAILKKEHLVFLHQEAPERYRFLLEGLPVTLDPEAVGNRVLLALDCSDPARLGVLEEKARGLFLVNIDHHISNGEYGSLNLVDTGAAATGEIVYRLARLLGVEIPAGMAEALYTSISTDTGGFRFDNTTRETFLIMAELMGTGFNLREVSLRVFDEISPAFLCLLRGSLQGLTYEAGGKIACLTVTDELMGSCDALEENLDGLVNYAVNIRGVEVGLLFRARDSGEVKVGFRSKRVDVSRMAATLGGGGHKKAAGCTLTGSLEEVRARVLELALKEVCPRQK